MNTRVLLINEFPSLNGGERSLLANLYLQRDDFEFVASAPVDGALNAALNDLGITNVPLNGTSEISFLSLVEQCKPDLIHANSLNTSRLIGRIAEQLSIPILGHCRDIFGLSRKAVADLNRLTKMIFVSKSAFEYHVAQGVRSDFGTVIHNGVDLDQFQPQPPSAFLHRELGLPASGKILLSIGQIGMRKGLDFLLESFEQVCRTDGSSHLLIVGQRYSQKDEAIEYERCLHERAAKDILRDRVHFLGTRDDVAEMLNEAVLLVHAARQEPLGRVLLEACASGLPVVATDVGGTREIYPSNDCGGLCVDKDDRDGFGVAILRLLDDRSLCRKMKLDARNRAVKAFNCQESARQVSEIYRNLTTSRTSTPR